jgi:hypothetical protein
LNSTGSSDNEFEMGGGRGEFSDLGKSPLLRKAHRNRYNEKAVIKNAKVHTPYTSVNDVKVLIDETCNTHGLGHVE